MTRRSTISGLTEVFGGRLRDAGGTLTAILGRGFRKILGCLRPVSSHLPPYHPDGYGPFCHRRALRTLMPAPAAAASCVLPCISFLRNTLTCASVTMEPLPAPFHVLAARTATTGQFICRTRRIDDPFQSRHGRRWLDQPEYLAAFATAWKI
jgi:hypothetical protein